MRLVVVCLAIPFAILSPAWAEPLSSQQTLMRWVEAFNAGKPDEVAALYTENAKLWGTISPSLTSTPSDVRAYFDRAAKSGLKVRIIDQATNEIADTVIIAGRYDFERIQDGKTVDIPVRYSFVLVKQGDMWKIAHQHSSPLPKSTQ